MRVLVIVAHLSINRSLGELFANDSNEKRVNGVTREEGRRAQPKKRKASERNSRESQMFALVFSLSVDKDLPSAGLPHTPSGDFFRAIQKKMWVKISTW